MSPRRRTRLYEHKSRIGAFKIPRLLCKTRRVCLLSSLADRKDAHRHAGDTYTGTESQDQSDPPTNR